MKIRTWLVLLFLLSLVTGVARSQDLDKLKRQLNDPDPKIRQAAAVKLGKHGKAAVPLLKTVLHDNLRTGTNSGAQMRGYAMTAAAEIGAPAEPLIPDLLFVLFKYPAERPAASLALGKIGKASGEALKNFASNPKSDPQIRRYALEGFGHMGNDAKDYLGDIVPLLKDGDVAVRTAGLTALGNIGPDAKDAFDIVTSVANRDSVEAVRLQAAIAMAQIQPDGEETTKVVKGMMGNPVTATSIVNAAIKLGGSGVPLLVISLKTGDDKTQYNTLQAMLKSPAVDARVLPGILPLLESPVAGVKNAAVSVLSKLGSGPGAAEAAPALGKLLKDKTIRERVLPVLERMGPAAGGAAPGLGDLLLEGNDAQTKRVLTLLAKMGESSGGAASGLLVLVQNPAYKKQVDTILANMGKSAVPALVKSLEDQNVVVRQSAVRMIAGLKGQGQDAAPALSKALMNDPDSEVRRQALIAFEEIGLGMDAALGIVLVHLEKEPEKKAALINSIGDLGDRAKPAVPLLSKEMKNPNPLIRVSAVSALQKVGIAGVAAVPDIAPLLTDKDPKVRQAAAQALEAIGIDAKAAVPQVIKLLQSPEADDRAVAAKVLIAMEFASVPSLGELVATHPNMVIRRDAARCLAKLAPKAGEAVPQLIVALDDPNDDVRKYTMETMLALEDEVVPHLANARKDKRVDVRKNAIDMLVGITPKAKGSTGALLDFVIDPDPTISGKAMDFFVKNKAPHMRFLIAQLKSLDKQHRLAAAKVLTRFGKGGAAALAALRAAAKDPDKEVSQAMQNAIAAITKK